MRCFVSTDETGRILASTTFEEYATEDTTEFNVPDDFDFDFQDEYRIVDGVLTHDPLPEPKEDQIAVLKGKLAETDYVSIKIHDATVTNTPLSDEENQRYAKILIQRQEWRNQINELESEVNQNG